MLGAPAAVALEVLGSVRERTRAHVSVALHDVDALTIAITCGSVEARALLEYAQEGTVRSDALGAMDRLALSDAEFEALFGTADPAQQQHHQQRARLAGARAERLVAYEALSEARAMRARMEAALSTTLGETAQRAAWHGSPALRVAAEVALCRASDASRCLAAVVGGMVRADERRVDDLKTGVEDAGLDIMVVAQAIAALAASVA